jgi:retron-type reverse transcriptase
MMRFVEHRVGDRRVLRLIRGWLTAGVVEDGVRQRATKGTPQGAVIPVPGDNYDERCASIRMSG